MKSVHKSKARNTLVTELLHECSRHLIYNKEGRRRGKSDVSYEILGFLFLFPFWKNPQQLRVTHISAAARTTLQPRGGEQGSVLPVLHTWGKCRQSGCWLKYRTKTSIIKSMWWSLKCTAHWISLKAMFSVFSVFIFTGNPTKWNHVCFFLFLIERKHYWVIMFQL